MDGETNVRKQVARLEQLFEGVQDEQRRRQIESEIAHLNREGLLDPDHLSSENVRMGFLNALQTRLPQTRLSRVEPAEEEAR